MKKNTNPLAYRAVTNGLRSLSDTEIMSLVIGERKTLSLSPSDQLLELAKQSYNELINRGLTHREALLLACSFELGNRKVTRETWQNKPLQMLRSSDIKDFMYDVLADLNHEEFWVIFLNRNNRVIKRSKHTSGVIAGTVAEAKTILKEAILCNSSTIVVVHNHPSGHTKPSQADIALTKKINEAAKIMDIKLLDHVIFYNTEHFSFADEGLL